MTDDHQLDELASAHLDGATSASEAARIASDPDLQARVEALQAVRTALRASPPVDPSRREAAISAALAAFAEDGVEDEADPAKVPTQVTSLAAARWGPSPRTLRLLGAAALIVALAALVPLLGRFGDRGGDDSASGDVSGTSLTDRETSAAGGSKEAAPDPDDPLADLAPSLPPDLGDFDDLDALVATLDASDPDSYASGAPNAAAEAAGDDGLAAKCLDAETEASQAQGAVTVAAATATVGGDAVIVLVTTDDVGVRTLRVYLAGSCRLLVEQPI